MRSGTTAAAIVLFIATSAVSPAFSEDWPTYNHDNRRSAVTAEHFDLPLHEHWSFQAAHKPAPAWPNPAPRDIWHKFPKLNPRMTFDRAFHVVSAGDALYFSSSSDDKIYSLDAETGEIRWTYFTGGPVRLAPTISNSRVYAGSDDGFVYCLDADNGSVAWIFDPGIGERKIPGNGRMISVCPVRSGVLVDDGIAYFSAGLFPSEGVGLFAVDSATGAQVWSSIPEGLSPQGYLLGSASRLYVPTGRTTPVAFDRNGGAQVGTFRSPRDGGTFALVTEDTIVSGPGKELVVFDTASHDRILTFAGKRMIVANDTYYLLSDNDITAFDRAKLLKTRKEQAALQAGYQVLADSLQSLKASETAGRKDTMHLIGELSGAMTELISNIRRLKSSEHTWKTRTGACNTMILADDILFLGGTDAVIALDASSGRELWRGRATGEVYGLAAANGRLFASTDSGSIHCFGQTKRDRSDKIEPVVESNPYPRDSLTPVYESAAKEIAGHTGSGKGYCIVLDCGEGRLMYELARRTGFKIIGIGQDPETVVKARKLLDSAGLYGTRAVVHEGNHGALPYIDYIANLIVCDETVRTGKLPLNPVEVYRLLKPSGGTVVLGVPENSVKPLSKKAVDSWLSGSDKGEWNIEGDNGLWVTVRRPALPGGGEWTHQYADPGNSAASGDTIVKSPVRLQWFGRPGPQYINDRHHRPMSPLYKNGRVFVIGNNHITAADAYNGSILWEKSIPGSRRVGVIRDCGHAAAASDVLYIAAEDRCLALDSQCGETVCEFRTPPRSDGERRFWGYVAYAGDSLFGSAMKPTAPRTTLGYETILQGTYFDNKPIVSSDCLFSMDRNTGTTRWLYNEGIILNTTIAIAGDAVYFVKTTDPRAVNDHDGRVLLTDALSGGYGHLVKIDRRTGDTIWSQPVDFPFEHTMYLSVRDTTILAIGSYNSENSLQYGLFGFDTRSGNVKWRNTYKYGDTLNGDHGEQDQHPVIVGDTVFSRPYDFNLLTGEKGTFNLVRGGHGCGTISGSAFYLFGRGGTPRMYRISEQGSANIALSMVNRPGCFINMIPAGGLVLLPESSSGCTCAYPIQASVVYVTMPEMVK